MAVENDLKKNSEKVLKLENEIKDIKHKLSEKEQTEVEKEIQLKPINYADSFRFVMPSVEKNKHMMITLMAKAEVKYFFPLIAHFSFIFLMSSSMLSDLYSV